MQITKATDYALRAMMALARDTSAVRSAPKLAEETRIPTRFLAKILSKLVRADLLVSTPGARGGFKLSRPAHTVSAWEVIEAMEDHPLLVSCLAEEDHCPEKGACGLQHVWELAQSAMERELRRATMDEVARRGQALKKWPGETAKNGNGNPVGCG